MQLLVTARVIVNFTLAVMQLLELNICFKFVAILNKTLFYLTKHDNKLI